MLCTSCNRVSPYKKNEPRAGWCGLARGTSSICIPHTHLGQRLSCPRRTRGPEGLAEGGCGRWVTAENVGRCLLAVCFECMAFSFCSCILPGAFPTPVQEGGAAPGERGGLCGSVPGAGVGGSSGKLDLGGTCMAPGALGVRCWGIAPTPNGEKGVGVGALLRGGTSTLRNQLLWVLGDPLPTRGQCWASAVRLCFGVTRSQRQCLLSLEICIEKQRNISWANIFRTESLCVTRWWFGGSRGTFCCPCWCCFGHVSGAVADNVGMFLFTAEPAPAAGARPRHLRLQ